MAQGSWNIGWGMQHEPKRLEKFMGRPGNGPPGMQTGFGRLDNDPEGLENWFAGLDIGSGG